MCRIRSFWCPWNHSTQAPITLLPNWPCGTFPSPQRCPKLYAAHYKSSGIPWSGSSSVTLSGFCKNQEGDRRGRAIVLSPRWAPFQHKNVNLASTGGSYSESQEAVEEVIQKVIHLHLQTFACVRIIGRLAKMHIAGPHPPSFWFSRLGWVSKFALFTSFQVVLLCGSYTLETVGLVLWHFQDAFAFQPPVVLLGPVALGGGSFTDEAARSERPRSLQPPPPPSLSLSPPGTWF